MAPRRFSIGRAADCDVVIADSSVSRRHAELEVDREALRLVDCRSTHGTHVIDNGHPRRVVREAVTPETIVQFGDSSLSVGDLLEAIQLKYPALAFGARPPAGGPRDIPHTRGTRLVRCGCGVIKPKGTACPGCGS